MMDRVGGLRLMLFDRTCRGGRFRPGLSHAWAAGGRLYHRLGRIDRWYGAASWAEGLDWLIDASRDRSIAEIQFWGHGRWGGLWIEDELLEADALSPGHRHHARLAAIATRLTPQSLWWFRSCDVFGTELGHQFARAWTRFFGCRAAGHTYTINMLQSGLHVLGPDEEPTWSVTEGVTPGLDHAATSSVFAPNTISFLHGRVRT
jgi:hypothetical protein